MRPVASREIPARKGIHPEGGARATLERDGRRRNRGHAPTPGPPQPGLLRHRPHDHPLRALGARPEHRGGIEVVPKGGVTMRFFSAGAP